MKIVAALLVLMLAGCMTPRTGPTVNSAGVEPTPEQANAAIQKFLARTLKDSDSVKQFRMTVNGASIQWYRGLINGGGNDQGYLYCFEYNAKNSYGAYAGVKTEGIVLRMMGDEAYDVPVNWGIVSRRC